MGSNNVVLVKGYISLEFHQILDDVLKILSGKRVKLRRKADVLERLLRVLRDSVDLTEEMMGRGFPFVSHASMREFEALLRPRPRSTNNDDKKAELKDIERILSRLADGWEVTEADKQLVRSYIEETISFAYGNVPPDDTQTKSVQHASKNHAVN